MNFLRVCQRHVSFQTSVWVVESGCLMRSCNGQQSSGWAILPVDLQKMLERSSLLSPIEWLYPSTLSPLLPRKLHYMSGFYLDINCLGEGTDKSNPIEKRTFYSRVLYLSPSREIIKKRSAGVDGSTTLPASVNHLAELLEAAWHTQKSSSGISMLHSTLVFSKHSTKTCVTFVGALRLL